MNTRKSSSGWIEVVNSLEMLPNYLTMYGLEGTDLGMANDPSHSCAP